MSWSSLVPSLPQAFNSFMLCYFAVLNLIYTILVVLGWHGIRDYVRRRSMLDYETMASSPLTMPISIVAPAYNEERVIVQSVRALLRARYPRFEVIVVNDGSTDGTFAALAAAFDLVRVNRVARSHLETQPITGVYVSPTHPGLLVVDKQNGGKADSINAGLVFARYPLFCCIDCDTIIEDDALVRLVRPFQVHPETVACGGVVRIVNGSTVADGVVRDVRTPRSVLVNVQIVEYLRAFMTGRVGWSRVGALLIISGAFGLFRRQDVVDAGGYDPTTVGEDAEMVVRLHRRCRDAGRPYRVVFVADPVCWTEAPSSLRVLARQRNRWHRGLVEVLVKHRRMALNPRYGVVGLFALPYFIVFEALGPVIELAGYVNVVLALSLGWITWGVALVFGALAMLYGLVLSFGALLVEEHAFRRYRSWRCTVRLMFAAVVENIGYRQLGTLMRVAAFGTLLRGNRSWGEMTRTGYTTPDDMPLEASPDAAEAA
jgi:cellulose synthase/poly-beta-1,6-N-acetylglucosamine synthase-like glycosyltransferase